MKRSNFKFSSLMLSLILAISSCAPSSKHAVNGKNGQNAGITENNDTNNSGGTDELPPIIEQEIVTTDDNFQKILEDQNKASEYQAPQTAIKNGDDLMYVGYTKLKNVKSVFDRTKQELTVSGIAEILNADKKSVRVSQEFKIKGKYKASSGTIKLRPVEESKGADAAQVRAVVTCFKSEDDRFDCGRAIIDLIIKHKGNYYTEQLEANSFAKPQMVGGKEKPAKPDLSVDLQDPEQQQQQEEDDSNQVKVTPDAKPVEKPQQQQQQPAQQPKPQKPVIDTAVVVTPAASKPVIVIDESKEEADPEALAEVEEGDEESIAGRYEGKAALVKLAKLFLSDKDIADLDSNNGQPKKSSGDDEDDEDDAKAAVVVTKDTKGRVRLSNQAVGSPAGGRLRNASFLKTHIDTYHLENKVVIANSSPKNYYGTQEMMEILEAVGEKINTIEKNKIFISRISAKAGGYLPPSKSHQNGMDVDIGYPTVNGKVQFPIVASGGSIKKSDFSASKTLEVFKFLMTQQVSPVDRLFVDQAIINKLCRVAKDAGAFRSSEKAAYTRLFENMQHVDGHGNHFHLRLRCTPNQPDCRHIIYKKMNNCAG